MNREPPTTNSLQPVSLVGASMAPALPPGTQVLVDPARAPHPGDVVLLRSGTAQLLHVFLGWGPRRGHRFGLHRGFRPGPWGVFRDDELLGVVVAASRRGRALPLPRRAEALSRSWWPRTLAMGARYLGPVDRLRRFLSRRFVAVERAGGSPRSAFRWSALAKGCFASRPGAGCRALSNRHHGASRKRSSGTLVSRLVRRFW